MIIVCALIFAQLMLWDFPDEIIQRAIKKRGNWALLLGWLIWLGTFLIGVVLSYLVNVFVVEVL